jgi:Icc-related predicted phosphoesterase
MSMNIAVFADLHGRVLLAFKLCARWQQETGETIDLILQAGDLGAFSGMETLDKASRRYAEKDPTELGFIEHFRHFDQKVAAQLAKTTCPMISVRGNHEDHTWLDELERQSSEAIFAIDAYKRVYNLKTGVPWTFQKGNEQLTILGVGRVEAQETEEYQRPGKYIQKYEQRRLYALDATAIDVLLTHDARPDFVILERGVKIKVSSGMPEIAYLLDRDRPPYHFFGHYGGPAQLRTDLNGVTNSIKLADLHWDRRSTRLEDGSMGLLRWQSRGQHSFEVLDTPWLKEYAASTWKYL